MLSGYSPESVFLACARVLRPAFPVERSLDVRVVDSPPLAVAGVERCGPRREAPGVVDDDDGPAAGELKVGVAGRGSAGDENDGAPLVAEGKGPGTGTSRMTFVS